MVAGKQICLKQIAWNQRLQLFCLELIFDLNFGAPASSFQGLLEKLNDTWSRQVVVVAVVVIVVVVDVYVVVAVVIAIAVVFFF